MPRAEIDLASAYYFPADEAEAEADAEEEESAVELPPGVHDLLEDFAGRRRALDMVEGAGRALAHTHERFRRDPDIVLLAAGSCAEALNFAEPALLADRDFALEAVQWNWRCLAFLPEHLRGDRAVVRAAVRQNKEAQKLAVPPLQEDASILAESRAGALAGLSCCEDEVLRLVGPCNSYRMTDARLRFRRVSHRAGTVKHRLILHLSTGLLDFQVVSSIWQSAVRVFPLKGGDGGHFRLVRGQPGAITAAVGGEEDGEEDHFRIEEGAGALVSVFVELSADGPGGSAKGRPAPQRGPAARKSAAKRRAMVWYCLEKEEVVKAEGAVSLEAGEEPRRSKAEPAVARRRGAGVGRTQVLADAEADERWRGLLLEAQALSERTFPRPFSVEDLDLRVALLADAQGEALLGYCLYSIEEEDHAIWVDQIAVAEAQRRSGLGRELIQWAVEKGKSAGCTWLRLNSRNRALAFYTRLGFSALADATSPGCRTMELQL